MSMREEEILTQTTHRTEDEKTGWHEEAVIQQWQFYVIAFGFMGIGVLLGWLIFVVK